MWTEHEYLNDYPCDQVRCEENECSRNSIQAVTFNISLGEHYQLPESLLTVQKSPPSHPSAND